MSKPFEPNGTMHAMTQFDEMTKAYRDAMPREFASTVNLLAHPVAGFAAAGAVGLSLAGHAMGLWMGALAGMADASRKLLEDATTSDTPKSKPARLKLVSSTPAPKAAAAAARAVVADAGIAVRETAKVTTQAIAAASKTTSAKAAPRKKAAVHDDLKAISGIGPKLEKVLNGFGIETYEQIAALTSAEIAKLDEQLGFGGRIERDDWLGQARKLAGK